MKLTRVWIDLAKNLFQVHGIDERGKALLREQLRRAQVAVFFRTLPPCVIGMEACASAHYWARTLQRFGHTVRLIAPQFVKPYVQTHKNDVADAEAICEAVGRPKMRFVPIKSVEQQAMLSVHRVRQGFVKARTVSLLVMVMVSWSSDRRNERQLHAAISLLIAAAGLDFVGATPSLTVRVALWCAVASGLVSYLGPFWAFPGEFLCGRSAASALAFINSFGSLGFFFSLLIIGSIAKRTGSLEGGFQAVAIALLLAAALILVQKLYRPQLGALAPG
jgi:hypothetical protein